MERSTRLDLPMLLPDVRELQDECIARLIRLLERRDGVVHVHVVRAGELAPSQAMVERGSRSTEPMAPEEAQLCLHYDPERLSLSTIIQLARAAGATVTDRFAHVVVPFQAVGTEDAGRRIEEGLRDLDGVTAASVNFAGQIARVEYDTRRVAVSDVARRLEELGTLPVDRLPTRDTRRTAASHVDAARPTRPREAAPVADHDEEHGDHEADPQSASWLRRNRELVWSLAAGFLLLVAWLLGRFAGVPRGVTIAIYLASYFFGSRDNVGHFLKDLRKGHFHFSIDLLMVIAAIGAAILGEWLEGALLLFLFSLGHAAEHYALGRARNAIKALSELAPSRALLIRDGKETEVSIEEVKPGDRVLVKPAERIPVDGTVREGRSSVNQAPITGESMPVGKEAGAVVYAGSVNGEGALTIEVTSAVGDRTLDRVIKLVAEAETQKAPTQQFTDRFERIFVPLVLVADLLLIVLPPLLAGWGWHVSFYRGMALLVAASPCALALGTPAAVLAGIAQAARKGVLIKGGAYLETLGTIDILALDKTGTITKGEPAVTDLAPADGVDEVELLSMTAAVERRSQHPLARAIMKAAEGRAVTVPDAGELSSVTGKGVRATVDGRTVEVGRLLMFEDGGSGSPSAANVPEAIRESVTRLEGNGRTTMTVRTTSSGDGAVRWLGVIGIADEPRADVRATLDRLRATGIKRIVMLTGDNAGVGNAVGSQVGVDEVRADLLPEDKVEAIKALAAEGRVAMVGDGVNDAPALAHATVGIAMGGAGTAAALETADIALMGDDLGRLPFAVGLSRQARAIIKQNLYVSLGVIGLLAIATVTGRVGIGPAVVVHEGSTLLVLMNALRLLTYGRE